MTGKEPCPSCPNTFRFPPFSPPQIPRFLLDDFTYQGRVPVQVSPDGYFDQASHDNTRKETWQPEDIDSLVSEELFGDKK